MLTGLYLMSWSSSKYSVIPWFWPLKCFFFLIKSVELDFFITRKCYLSSFPKLLFLFWPLFCSEAEWLSHSPRMKGYLDSSHNSSLVPLPQWLFLSHLFYHHFNSGLHHLLPRSLVIIVSSCYFAKKHIIVPQSDIQEPLQLPHIFMPPELFTAISKFPVLSGLYAFTPAVLTLAFSLLFKIDSII